MVQNARDHDSVGIREVKQNVGRRRRPTAQADGQFVACTAHFWLLKQRARFGVDPIEEAVGRADAFLGDI